MKQNDFSLTHCDIHMTQKLEIVFIAGIYNKSYHDIMDIFESRDQENSDWTVITTKANV